jgi:hypothetical protein
MPISATALRAQRAAARRRADPQKPRSQAMARARRRS